MKLTVLAMKLAVQKSLDSPERVIVGKVNALLNAAFAHFPVGRDELDVSELTRIKNDIGLLLLILRSSRISERELPRITRVLTNLEAEASGCFHGVNSRVCNTITHELRITIEELQSRSS